MKKFAVNKTAGYVLRLNKTFVRYGILFQQQNSQNMLFKM